MDFSERSKCVLICDSNQELRGELADYFRAAGFEALECAPDDDVSAILCRRAIGLVLLDPYAADRPVELLRSVGGRSATGCIVYTANARIIDRIVALEHGADDYLIKPVDKREMLARARALLRRLPEGVAQQLPIADLRNVSVGGGLTFDRLGRCLKGRSGEVPLTTAEHDLLSLLVDAANKPVQRDVLCLKIFRRQWTVEDRAIDSLIVRLRRKMGVKLGRSVGIKSVRGFGYMLVSAQPYPRVSTGLRYRGTAGENSAAKHQQNDPITA